MTQQATAPRTTQPLHGLIERTVAAAPHGLIAVLGMSPPHWPEGAVFVFDDEVSVIDAVAGRWGDAPPDLDVLFVRRSELAMLGYQPSELILPAHPDLWARTGTVLWGDDVRGEIPAIGDARTRLAINVERASNAMRRPILACLIMNRPDKLIPLLGGEIAELRRSVEILAATGAEPPAAVDEAFEAWREAAGGRSIVRAAWRFERVLIRLRRWLYGDQASRAPRRPSRRAGLARHQVLQPYDAIEARYQAQVHAMLADLTPIGDHIVSVLLIGSVASHAVRPGVSDLMDAFVIVDDEVFESEALHDKVLSTFVRACWRLAACGLPFHPFRYQSREEITQAAVPFFNAVWRTDARSLVLAGEDLRPMIRSSAAGRVWGERAFFPHALRYRRFAAFGRAGVESADREWLFRAVRGELKPLPFLACLSCGELVDTHDAPATLARLFDAIDLSPYDAIGEIHERAKRDEKQVPVLVKSAVDFVETIASRTAEWVHRHREPAFWRV